MGEAERSRTRRLPLYKYVDGVKKDQKCTECGFSNYKILQYHHLDPSTKKFSISNGITYMMAIEDLKAEIAKCVLLCPNCHCLKHLNGG
jgi:hypothetical protein